MQTRKHNIENRDLTQERPLTVSSELCEMLQCRCENCPLDGACESSLPAVETDETWQARERYLDRLAAAYV